MERSRGRLTRSDDFARVYRAGRSVASKYLVLYYFDRLGAAGVEVVHEPRVGLSVSKRLGNAVDRNRIKRVLREALRANGHLLRGNMDFVIVARAPLMRLLEEDGFRAVEDKMLEVLGKASLFSPERQRRRS